MSFTKASVETACSSDHDDDNDPLTVSEIYKQRVTGHDGDGDLSIKKNKLHSHDGDGDSRTLNTRYMAMMATVTPWVP